MTINMEICLNVQNANYCFICAGRGEEGCPLLSDNRYCGKCRGIITGERRMFDRRIWNRRATDANPVEARA